MFICIDNYLMTSLMLQIDADPASEYSVALCSGLLISWTILKLLLLIIIDPHMIFSPAFFIKITSCYNIYTFPAITLLQF